VINVTSIEAVKPHVIYIPSSSDRNPVIMTSRHFTIPHPITLHYTCRHYTFSHLNFTQLHYTTLHYPPIWLNLSKFPTAPFNVTSLHFSSDTQWYRGLLLTVPTWASPLNQLICVLASMCSRVPKRWMSIAIN